MSYSEEEIESAQKKLEERVEKVKELIAACEKIAREYKLSFTLNIAYGMGGYFDGAATEDYHDNEFDPPGGWLASSMSC